MTVEDLHVMFCLIFFIGSALEIYLKGQNSNICLGHNLIAVCKIDRANAFVWSAPPLFDKSFRRTVCVLILWYCLKVVVLILFTEMEDT